MKYSHDDCYHSSVPDLQNISGWRGHSETTLRTLRTGQLPMITELVGKKTPLITVIIVIIVITITIILRKRKKASSPEWTLAFFNDVATSQQPRDWRNVAPAVLSLGAWPASLHLWWVEPHKLCAARKTGRHQNPPRLLRGAVEVINRYNLGITTPISWDMGL